MRKKIVAFAASSSSRSINHQLVEYVSGLATEADVELLDLNHYELPLFSVDREDELGQPQLARDFVDKIGASDAVLISFAEHNGSYSAAYKSLFDWASRINPKVYQDKPMVLLATSPGGRGGQSVLELARNQMPRFGGQVVASVSVPSFGENFNSDTGAISDAEIDSSIRSAIASLMSA